jgi:hypothetical protein
MGGWWIGALLAAGATEPDLSWLAGHWLSCEGGREVSETWTDPRGGLMIGMSVTLSPAGKPSWEVARIERDSEGKLAFHAQPGGVPPTAFALAAHGPRHAVFENGGHDFPQKVSYRRVGNRLFASIEGTIGTKRERMSWTFERTPLNRRCRKG